MDIDHNIVVKNFEALAKNHKSINDFFRMDLTEIQGAFRSTANFPCLVVESHQGDLSDSSRHETINDRAFAFTIYLNPDHDDFDEQNIALATAENIGLSVIARMKHDATLVDHFTYNKFLVSTVKYAKVGPVFNERLYGYRFVGSIMGNEPLKYDIADWCDSPTKCE